jgi:GT2 family glycosyltransferase
MIQVDGKFFARDGRRFPVRGVTYGTFAPREPDGVRFPTRPQMKTDLVAMREAGFNTVRTYTTPPEDLLDFAGECGLQVFVGVHWNDWRYLIGSSARERRAVARTAVDVVRDEARRLAGRPEVFALCVGNEIPADVVRWVGAEKVADLVEELAWTVHSVDPDRLVTYANYPSSEYLSLRGLDFSTYNVFLERPGDLRKYVTRLHNLIGDRPLVIGELGRHAGPGDEGEAEQARSLDEQLSTVLERGVAGTCTFSWTDDWHVGDAPVEGWRFGLTRADRSPRPALEVAATWNRRTVADLLPADEWPSMAVVICAYNAAETLGECLAHACDLEYRPLEIIVVDDGSTDETASIVARHPRARLVRIEHAGLAVARNAGFESASAEVVAYLDADAYPSPEWLYYLALGLDSRFVGGVGGPNVSPILDPPGAARVAQAPGGPIHVLVADDRAEHIPGCNMAFFRDVLTELGGFEPVYTAAGDDVDFCWRVLDRGFEIGFHPAALVWHHRRPTTRAYLRQQRGYGRAEAIVASRHPDRFTGLGSARWRGRLYGSGARAIARQRIYRGAYGGAAFQSVYAGGGSALDVAHQVGVPAALLVLLIALPFALPVPVLIAPPVLALTFLLGLTAIDAIRTEPPARTARSRRLAFRSAVAVLSILQPIARAWGRMRHETTALRGLPAPRSLQGPVGRTKRGVLVLPGDQPREAIAAGVVDAVRRAGIAIRPPTGWEEEDASLLGSLVLAADVVTVGEPAGVVQVRIRRRVRPLAVALVVLATIAAAVNWPLAVGIGAVVIVEVLRGMWRTGPVVRKAVRDAAISAAEVADDGGTHDGGPHDEAAPRGEGCLRPDLVLEASSKNPLSLSPETDAAVRAAPLPSSPRKPGDASAGRGRAPGGSAVLEASIVVVVLDNLVCTRLCLESVFANTDGSRYETIVVDNGSGSETREYLEALATRHARIRLIRHETNKGFPRAMNDGLRAARGRVLVLLNNDTVVPPGWLTGLTRHLTDPTVGMVGPVTNDTGDPSHVPTRYRTYGELLAFCRQRSTEATPCEVDMVTMFCAAMRRDVYQTVGPLDESFGIGMFEDDDYARRLAGVGLRSVRAYDVFVHHFGRATLGHLVTSGEHGRLFDANRSHFEEKWAVTWRPPERIPDPVYEGLKARVRLAVQASVPAGAHVAVLSRGDDDLVAAAGSHAVHFPSAEDGSYAGFNPSDDAEALRWVEQLRRRGCTHLVVPATATWWMEYYPDLRAHLQESAEQATTDPDTCLIFRFRTTETAPAPVWTPSRAGRRTTREAVR